MSRLPRELLTIVFQYLTNSSDPNYRALYQIDYFGLCRVEALAIVLQPLLQHSIENYEHVVGLLSPGKFKFTRPDKWRHQRPKKSAIQHYRKELIANLLSMFEYYTT